MQNGNHLKKLPDILIQPISWGLVSINYKMLKKKKHKTPLYRAPFTIVFYDKDEELEKAFKDIQFDPPAKEFDGGVFKRKEQLYIVFSTQQKNYPTPGIIAHEAKHLVNEIFIDIGHDLDRYNDEPEAYLLGWIVDKIHEFKDRI